jgi:hypothetical protein
MKNILISMAVTAITLTACNSGSNNSTDGQNAKKDSSTVTPGADQVYACSMHPEITGKKGDKCSKCDMELTAVKK